MAGNTINNDGDAESADGDAALTGIAAVAPQVAAAAAAIDEAGDVVDGANDAATWVGGAVDNLFGGDEHPGQSTFDVDPDAAPESEEEYQAKIARVTEEMEKGGAENHKRVHLWNGKHQGVQHAVQGSEAADMRWATKKARAGKVETAGTEVHGGVSDDPRMEGVGRSDAHVSDGDAVVDVHQLPTADHTPADVSPGSDVELNPQPIPPGRTGPLSDVDDASIIIVGGKPSARRAKNAGPGTTG